MPSNQFSGHLDSSDIISEFYVRYAQEVEGMWLDQLAMRVPSDRETEDYKWVGTASAPREWDGNRLPSNLNKFSMSLANKVYESTIDLSVDDMRRDRTGMLRARLSDMGAKAALHPQTLIAALITAADATTLGLAYDGQQFVDTDHSEGSSGTQTNDLTNTEIPSANVTTAGAPTPTEAANILAETIGYQYGYKDDQGDPDVNGSARSFVVVCATVPIWSAFNQAIHLQKLASGADNPLGGLKATKQINVSTLYLPRVTLADAVQLYRVDGAVKPYIWQEELYETVFIGPGSELEVNYRKHRFGTTRIARAGFGEWRSCVEVTMS